jgi:hypothetical protein
MGRYIATASLFMRRLRCTDIRGCREVAPAIGTTLPQRSAKNDLFRDQKSFLVRFFDQCGP